MLINEFEKLSLKKFKIKSILPDATILCLGKRRSGKSIMRGENVLMYDGNIKKVEDIKIGELVMGDDSTPRTVLETHSGTDKMYKVTNRKGVSYTVNSHHILSLTYTGKKIIVDRKDRQSYQVRWFNKQRCRLEHYTFSYKDKNKEAVHTEAQKYWEQLTDDLKVDIPILDYLKLSKKYRENLLGYQVPIQFQEKDVPIDPYMIGYWLGDGTSADSNITTQDSTVLHYFAHNLPQYNLFLDMFDSRRYGYRISSGYGQKNNVFLQTLKDLDLINNKHIPMIYKCNSREARLKLLAGFIDADGHLGKRNDLEITQCLKHERLIDDIIYLARSLGFCATKHIKKTSWSHKGEKRYGEAFRIHINAQGIDEIPTLIPRKRAKPSKNRVDALVSQIEIEEVGEGEYYGIELDGNNRFVLGNFIVTHNSWLVRDIFYHHRHIPSGVVFSGTEEASPFFGDFIPDCFIHSEYDPVLIESIMNRQKRKIREAKNSGKSDTGKLPSNNVFIVLDDMLHDAQNWKKDKTIKSIFFNGRHFNFLFILTMQYAQGIPPELRSNIDYVFIFNEPSVANRKRIYEAYAGMIPSFDHFCNILDACTQNHECLVIKTSGNSTDLKDQVFWYKAEAHSNFRAGHPKFWNYHQNHYNQNYEDEAEQDQAEVDKLKRKFAKTRKLKIIVSRQGEVVGYKQESD
uniref:DOD-type homing endonuclease domain-containing protein n=1 Tax=viral metagenome TaxID=1070528 RepID=A0A6C0H6M9_9ZZZZ